MSLNRLTTIREVSYKTTDDMLFEDYEQAQKHQLYLDLENMIMTSDLLNEKYKNDPFNLIKWMIENQKRLSDTLLTYSL